MIEARQASHQDELDEILRFRYEVFCGELGRTDIQGADHQNRLIRDDMDAGSAHFLCRDKQRIVAALAIGSLGGQNISPALSEFYETEKMFRSVPRRNAAAANWLLVDPEYRGSPVTVSILNAAYIWALEMEQVMVLTYCRPGLVNLYERLGFEQYRSATQLKGMGFRIPLLLLVNDEEHLASCRSPFIRLLVNHPARKRHEDARPALARDFDILGLADSCGSGYWSAFAAEVPMMESQAPNLLHGLGADDVRSLLKQASIIPCSGKGPVILAGETSGDMFLVVSGSFIVRGSNGSVIASLGRGDIFGEVAHLANCRRTASVEAVAEGEVAALNAARLCGWIEQNPGPGSKLALNLARILATRLAAAAGMLD